MGNICSISIPGDQLIQSSRKFGIRHANYLLKLPGNLAALESACERLGELRNDVKMMVDIAEREQMQPLEQVLGWLSRVETLAIEVNQLIGDGNKAIERKCVGGYCPRNCRSRYKLGKRAARKLEEVESLMAQAPIAGMVAERLPSPLIGERPTEGATVGMDSRLDLVWRSLNQEHVGIVGLYGLGGVGKTTLLTHLNNAFTTKSTTHDFDFVIWATVSKNVNHDSIQDDIWKKIGFCDDRWRSKSREEKAVSIWRVLKEKRFVLLLDDIWERLNLPELGVPLQNKRNYKIVFTTRSEDVCAQMEVDKKIKVECLTSIESWDLFQMKLGEDTLNFHPEIPKLAQVVAQECCGLPLVLTTMGRTMACKKTLQEWKYAIKLLQSSASKFPGMGDKVFPLLKYSYECLPTQAAKSCFLYSSLFPEDCHITKADLIRRWICEGFLDEFDNMEEAENQGYSIIGTLTHACLLEETHVDYKVKLHDVIRDMALWIACETEERGVQDKFLVQAGCGLTEAPVVAKWMGPKRISLMSNQIEKLTGSPCCPNLLTLFLQDNSLKMIPHSFFQFMPNLRVLDLSENGITELPKGISNLVSLQYLDLSYTNIRELPFELKNLGKLKCLMLYFMYQLSSIPEQLISSLSMLQVIQMFHIGLLSGDNETLVEELESLKYLHELSVTITSACAFESLLSSHKLKSHIRGLSLQNFKGSSSFSSASLGTVTCLQDLCISNCGSLEDLDIDWAMESDYLINVSGVVSSHSHFQSLEWVGINKCPRLKDLTWLVFAQNLKVLEVVECYQMQEIIGGDKWVESAENGEKYLNPFVRLQELFLVDLPQLKSIYWKALPFIYLYRIIVRGCPLLKKLPLNANSAKEDQIVIQGHSEWWKKVEWENESTKKVFLSCFVPTQE